jgi:hypothetical protein
LNREEEVLTKLIQIAEDLFGGYLCYFGGIKYGIRLVRSFP